RLADRFRAGISVVAQFLVLAIILKAAAEVGDRIHQGHAVVEPAPLVAAAIACIALHLGTLGAGLVSSRWLGLERPRQIAVAFAAARKPCRSPSSSLRTTSRAISHSPSCPCSFITSASSSSIPSWQN